MAVAAAGLQTIQYLATRLAGLKQLLNSGGTKKHRCVEEMCCRCRHPRHLSCSAGLLACFPQPGPMSPMGWLTSQDKLYTTMLDMCSGCQLAASESACWSTAKMKIYMSLHELVHVWLGRAVGQPPTSNSSWFQEQMQVRSTTNLWSTLSRITY